jgi:tRNA threonylcarbamoyladenosine biosynthesis protein TsaB
VALLVGDRIVVEVRLAVEAGHSKTLLPAVEMALRAASLEAGELDAVAGVTGPGAFTGLRVGLASLQGIALAADKSCVGVSSLEALAETVKGRVGRIVAMVDGFRSDVFAQDFDGKTLEPLGEARVTTAAAAAALGAAGVIFVGSGAQRYRKEIELSCPGAVVADHEAFLAVAVARIAARRARAGATIAPDELRPLYIRPPDIRP